MPSAFYNGKIFTGHSIETNKAILVEDGRVVGIVPAGNIPSQFDKEDLNGLNIAPSFIDLQIYGAFGRMFSHELSEVALQSVYEYSLHGGCGHFMITMATNTIEKFLSGI